MKACCYILYSVNLRKFYVGATQEILEARIQKHIQHLYGSQRFTASTDDWQLFIKISANDFAHAVRMERFIKSQKQQIH